ncbi:DMT family transporter [Candidatus Woesearchaeota archaeon]|nr:DMT family transporter [Candidatus Woesearchaeota archaeon]
MKEITKGKIALLISAIIWSLGFLMVRWMYSIGYSVYTFLFINWIISGFVFFLILKYKKIKIKPKRTDIKWLITLGFFDVATALTFIWSLILAKIAVAEFLHYTMPVWAFLFAVFWLKEKITRWKFFALIIALVGISLVFNLDSLSNGLDLASLGALLALASAVTYGMMMNLGRKLENVSQYVTSFWMRVVGTVILFFFFIFSITFKSWLDILIFSGYAIITSVIPLSLFFYGLRKVEATTSSILMLVEVPLASFWAFLFFKEGLTVFNIIGGIFILVSAVILIKKHKNQKFS